MDPMISGKNWRFVFASEGATMTGRWMEIWGVPEGSETGKRELLYKIPINQWDDKAKADYEQQLEDTGVTEPEFRVVSK